MVHCCVTHTSNTTCSKQTSCTCSLMNLTALTSRPQPALHRLQKAGFTPRTRSPVCNTARAASGTTSASKLNKVLFTIPWKVEFGQSLSVSGEGEELGQWNPDKSLPLKWNDGDLWAAEVPLPVGQKVEYKYVVKDAANCLKAWQPGSNCAVAVPTASDASLQIADDWHGKSRSVIFNNGEVESAPAGTFDGPPAQASSPPDSIHLDSASSQSHDTSNGIHSQPDQDSIAASTASPSQPVTAEHNGATANGLQPVDEPAAKESEGATEGAVVDDATGAPLQDLTVKDLKDRLKDRGLMVSGRKSELVDRLAAAKITETIE